MNRDSSQRKKWKMASKNKCKVQSLTNQTNVNQNKEMPLHLICKY